MGLYRNAEQTLNLILKLMVRNAKFRERILEIVEDIKAESFKRGQESVKNIK